jgi:hypothetical protein
MTFETIVLIAGRMLSFCFLALSRSLAQLPYDPEGSYATAETSVFAPSDEFHSADFPFAAATPTAINPPTSVPLEAAGVSPAWVIAVILVIVIGASLIAMLWYKKCRRSYRPTASEQIDEHATEPLLLPAEFF